MNKVAGVTWVRRRKLTSWRMMLAAASLIVALVSTLGVRDTAHARGSPHRNDRRPDRETRIRYPRARPASGNQATTGDRALRSAPPPTTPAAQDTPGPSTPEPQRSD